MFVASPAAAAAAPARLHPRLQNECPTRPVGRPAGPLESDKNRPNRRRAENRRAARAVVAAAGECLSIRTSRSLVWVVSSTLFPSLSLPPCTSLFLSLLFLSSQTGGRLSCTGNHAQELLTERIVLRRYVGETARSWSGTAAEQIRSVVRGRASWYVTQSTTTI
jgi:hypothetical protein